MKTLAKISALSLLAVCIATTSWAGGKSCSSGAKAEGAKATAAGSHCSTKDANAMAAKECGIKANQVIYSFAVPTVHCDDCTENVQKAAMAHAGIACVHVDLTSHTAYVIADKNVSRKEVAKVIAAAGYKNSFKAEGGKVQAEFAKAIASGDKGVACCAKSKDKV